MRISIVLFVLLVVLLAPPLAMASSNCAAMTAMCEGPCGIAVYEVSIHTSQAPLLFVDWLSSRPPDHVPAATPRLLELPPRSSLLPA